MESIIVLTILIFSACANANYFCSGKVSHLGSSDGLYMSNGFGVHYLCSMTEPRCNAWLSLLLTAKMSDRSVVVYYSSSSLEGGDQNHGLCTSIGSWVRPADPIYYVQIQGITKRILSYRNYDEIKQYEIKNTNPVLNSYM